MPSELENHHAIYLIDLCWRYFAYFILIGILYISISFGFQEHELFAIGHSLTFAFIQLLYILCTFILSITYLIKVAFGLNAFYNGEQILE